MKKLCITISFAFALASYSFGQIAASNGTELGADDANVYIDPVRKIVKVAYAVSKNSEVYFKVINDSGEIVFTEMVAETKGEHSKLIYLDKYPGKNYTVVVESDKLKQVEKIMFN
jgi:hypothetical protein